MEDPDNYDLFIWRQLKNNKELGGGGSSVISAPPPLTLKETQNCLYYRLFYTFDVNSPLLKIALSSLKFSETLKFLMVFYKFIANT